MKKVFVMSSVHPWNDTRIFYKECKTLAREYQVELHAVGDFDVQEVDGIEVHGLPKYSKRAMRWMNWLRLFSRGLAAKADIYHFHDPELLGVGFWLKLFTGKKVVYDVHEDFPAAVLTKYWIPKGIRKVMSALLNKWEKWISGRLDALVFAEFYYKENFTRVNTRKVDIVNYPVYSSDKSKRKDKNGAVTLVYAGIITESRGAVNMVEALAHLSPSVRDKVVLLLVGSVKPELMERLNQLVKKNQLEDKVIFTGRVSLKEVYQYYDGSDVGLALLHPAPNYTRSLATKIYEYMSVGMPIVASNFPMWVDLVEGNQCGVNVNPLDPEAIAKSIENLVRNPQLREEMGEKGFKAYQEKYNWDIEEKKLLGLYQELLQ